MDLLISGDDQVEYSPGALMVDISNGPPFVNVDISIDAGPVLLTVALDENGQANSVIVPVDALAGAHTLHAVTSS